ncbi:MAG: iron hydrogenase small subunit, partial [Syntrophomonas sp.]|nr:iron hydrogenase small subunit [Syntrophomonas sp.]
LSGTKVKVAVANSLGAARKIMDEIKAGTSPYHFIEVMCCPGGCIGGGGQPIPSTIAKKKERIEAIYVEDEGLPLRKSHDNPEVKKLYEDFLKEPLGHKSHELLHTHYHPSGK